MGKSSFNAFGVSKKDYGSLGTPIWIGKVSAAPVGGHLASSYLVKGAYYQAGCPINLTGKVITPFLVMKVISVASGVVTVDVGNYGIIPSTANHIQKVGSNDAATAITAVAKNATEGYYDITTALSVVADDIIVLTFGSTKIIEPNAYLYNDIYIGDMDVADESAGASGAAVFYHADGILIDRTPASLVKDAMAAAVPGVYQHNE